MRNITKNIKMKLKIAVLPGDGIGPEISKQGVNVLKAIARKFGHEFTFEEGLIGSVAIEETGDPFPKETLDLCLASDAVFFSAVGDPKYDNNPSSKVRPEQGLLKMRKELELYANIRPITTFDTLLDKSPLKSAIIKGADFVVIRELTGGMYFGEKNEEPDSAYDVNIYHRHEIERILNVAYSYAERRKKHLTIVDKANVLASSRLWRRVSQACAAEHKDITTDYMFVDNASMKLIQDPCFFDVIVTENTFGDILTDEASVITGSMGLLPSASLGVRTPLFEPIHGSWPEAAGQNIANPLAQILSGAMLLEHFGLSDEGQCVRNAVYQSLEQDVRTPEIQVSGGSYFGTKEVGDWIVKYIMEH